MVHNSVKIGLQIQHKDSHRVCIQVSIKMALGNHKSQKILGVWMEDTDITKNS